MILNCIIATVTSDSWSVFSSVLLHNFSHGWLPKLSVPKSSIMLIGTQQRTVGKTLNLSLNNVPLKQVSPVRYLGVYIDQHLTWHNHVEYVLRRVRGKLYTWNRLKPLTPTVMTLLYQAHVLLPVLLCSILP